VNEARGSGNPPGSNADRDSAIAGMRTVLVR
jgi:hypothetical protein